MTIAGGFFIGLKLVAEGVKDAYAARNIYCKRQFNWLDYV